MMTQVAMDIASAISDSTNTKESVYQNEKNSNSI